MNDETVRDFFNRDAHLLQFRSHCGDAVAFFVPQLFSAGNDGLAFGHCRGHTQDWKFIDRVWDSFPPDTEAMQPTRTYAQISYGFSGLFTCVVKLNISPHVSQDV